MSKTLYFELVSIALILVAGIVLIMNSLPGWGMIYVAVILTLCTLGLRYLNNRPVPAVINYKS